MRPFVAIPLLVIAAAACGGGGSEPPAVVASLTVSPPEPDTLFARNATLQINVVARDANNATISNPQLTFTSSNQNAATVSATGLVTAQNDGETIITVRAGSVSEVIEVNVRRRVTSVAVTPSPHTFLPGQTQQFSASPRDLNNQPVGGLTATFTSSNTAAVEITTAGLATAKALGTTTITATVTTVDGVRTGTASASVQNIPGAATVGMTASSFNPPNVQITASGTVTFSNGSGVDHNVDFATGIQDIPTHSSGSTTRTFPNPGTYNFQCTIHGPSMSGSVTVH